jgi:transcriptional regulator with XRE-family HTH domain
MRPAQLKTARQTAGWTQHEAAACLGVSQPYYCQLERGSRPVPADLMLTAFRKLRLSPVALPLPALSPQLSQVPPEELTAILAWLGYPGYAHVRKTRRPVNPAELVARALAHTDLEPRLMEALPWVLSTFHALDWPWLAAQCRLLNRQNQLGFLLTLATQLAKPSAERHLRAALLDLELSRLAAEGTLSRDSMSEAERNWVRKRRSAEAAHWNLLTTLTVDQLTHAA